MWVTGQNAVPFTVHPARDLYQWLRRCKCNATNIFTEGVQRTRSERLLHFMQLAIWGSTQGFVKKKKNHFWILTCRSQIFKCLSTTHWPSIKCATNHQISVWWLYLDDLSLTLFISNCQFFIRIHLILGGGGKQMKPWYAHFLNIYWIHDFLHRRHDSYHKKLNDCCQ